MIPELDLPLQPDFFGLALNAFLKRALYIHSEQCVSFSGFVSVKDYSRQIEQVWWLRYVYPHNQLDNA